MNATPGTADIIWSQIPSGVKVRLGARQAVGDNAKGYLHFTVGPNRRNKPLKVQIRLDPNDTYTVKLVRCDLRTGEATMLEEADGLYFDMLGELLVRWEGRHLVS